MLKNRIFILVLMFFTLQMQSQNPDSWQSIIQKLSDYQYTGISTPAPLPYSYDALEPSIDAGTMEIHYTKHHATYARNMEKAVKGNLSETLPLLQIFMQMDQYSVALRNNAGGFYNHEIFWKMLVHGGKTQPQGVLESAIRKDLGGMEKFREDFSQAALSRFGSGWAWLSVGADGKLFVSSTANQDNPFMNTEQRQGIPLLGLDVWEHAYYLKYQNRRQEYIDKFWGIVNWAEVERRYEEALKAMGK